MSATDDNRTAKQLRKPAAQLSSKVLGVGQIGYATDTKVTKIGDGVTAWSSLPALGGGGSLPYNVYTALISQSYTNDPTAIVLENTIGSIVWTRRGLATYDATLIGAFPVGSTFVLVSSPFTAFDENQTGDIITLRPPGFKDGFTNVSIEIRVYP